MDTTQKIEESLEEVSNEKFYKPLEELIVSQTAAKVKTIVNTMFANGHIDKMTYKWLNSGQNPPRIPEFYTLTTIHKPTPVGRPIVSGSGGPTERISSCVDSLLQPIAKKQESYIKDMTHFIITGLLVGRGKKVKFRGIFRGKFVEKTADFAGISREFSRPVSPKNDW